jgi:hypothetical protein
MNFTTKMRTLSSAMKASKDFTAKMVVEKTITAVTDVLEIYAVAAELIVEATHTGIAIARVAKDDPKAREQLQTLVAHTIGDVASRINEVANFAEAISKDAKVQERCQRTMQLNKALEDLTEKNVSNKSSRKGPKVTITEMSVEQAEEEIAALTKKRKAANNTDGEGTVN